jgi:hypothetical protein
MKESWATLYSGAQTNVHIGLDNGNHWGLAKKMELLLTYTIPQTTTIQTNCVTKCEGACGGIVLKMHAKVLIKLWHVN